MKFEKGSGVNEKDPFLDTFNTVAEFVVALEKKKGISVGRTEPIKFKADSEVVVAAGSDGFFYLLDQSRGKVMFIRSEENWNAAVEFAVEYLEKK